MEYLTNSEILSAFINVMYLNSAVKNRMLAEAYCRKNSPINFVQNKNQTKQQFITMLALCEYLSQENFKCMNVHNWSDEEIIKRSEEYAERISPAYHIKNDRETWENFHLRMALLGFEREKKNM